MTLNRRDAIKGAAATVALIACEAVVPAAAAVIVPTQVCGCPRVHEISYGHTCTVHDEKGRRWDAYTVEEIAAQSHAKIEVQTATTEWTCYCGRHDREHADSTMPVGTRCIWRQVSYFDNEWECDCVDAFRDDWLNCVTTDWIAMAKEDGLA